MNDIIHKILKTNLGCIAVLCVLIFLAYGFVLNASFKTMDDSASIVTNEAIQSFQHLKIIFTHSFFGADVYYRPLVSLSFMTEYHFFKLDAFYYYLTNLLIHIATAAGVFLLLEILLKNRLQAFCVTLLFAIHPMHWEAVSNIPGRAILLAAFFSIHAFRLFCLGKKNKFLYISSLLLFILALLSKESSTMLPLVLLSYQFFLERKPQQRLREIIKPVLPFFAIEIIYVLLRRSLGITKLYLWRSPQESVLGFLTFLRSVMTNLRAFFLPFDLHFDRAQELFTGLLDIQVAFTVLFYLALGYLLGKFRRRVSARTLFFLSWFWIELIPVSQILVGIGVQPGYISIAEHFFYLASISIFVFCVQGASFLYERNKENAIIAVPVARVIVVAVYLFFMLITIQQSIYSSHEITMLKRSLEVNPANTRLRYNLGSAYAKRGLYEEAEKEFRTVLQSAPDVPKFRISLGKVLCDQGKYWEGLEEYRKVTKPEKMQELLDYNLKATYTVLKEKYQKIVAEQPQNAQAHYTLGVVTFLKGEYAEAVEHYKQAIALKPKYPEAIFNLAASYAALGNFDQATNYYNTIIRRGDPKGLVVQSYIGLSQIAQDLGDLEQAKKYRGLANKVQR